MHSAPTAIDPLLSAFWEVISSRGWCKATESCSTAIQSKLARGECIFRTLLNLDFHGEPDDPHLKLSSAASRLLQQVCEAGISLHLGWPRVHREAVDDWLGHRFFFSASPNFAASERYVSLVSSQLGRHGSKLPNWPRSSMLHCKTRSVTMSDPLILTGTSLSDATQQFSKRADLSSLKIQIDDKLLIQDWLSQLLCELESASASKSLESLAKECFSALRLSPPEKQSTVPEIASLPIQDRIAFALADRVIAVYVRSKGTIATWLSDEYRTNVFLQQAFMSPPPLVSSRVAKPNLTNGLTAVQWVGCYKSLRYSLIGFLPIAKVQFHSHALNPFAFRCPPIGSTERWNDGAWPFLTHCTRGNSGPLPSESLEHFRDRAWSVGVIPNSHPLCTLQQILNDARIKGNTRLTRSDAACVSFSEVPLAELLSRRQFRSHLGRWDWEPYGILVRREVLEQLGARRVVYGDESDFEQLSDEDKPYFQPRGTKNARVYQDWTSEREWRLLRDLNFAEIPFESMLVFVATKTEAQQVARRCKWPVVWKETGSGSRQGFRSAGIGNLEYRGLHLPNSSVAAEPEVASGRCDPQKSTRRQGYRRCWQPTKYLRAC